jgi:hypothetical protein
MIYWVREVVGWALLALGVLIFLVVIVLLLQPAPRLFESGPLSFIGFVVFRGGVSLIRAALAARICQQAALQFPEKLRTPTPAPRPLPGVRLPATPPATVGARRVGV